MRQSIYDSHKLHLLANPPNEQVILIVTLPLDLDLGLSSFNPCIYLIRFWMLNN